MQIVFFVLVLLGVYQFAIRPRRFDLYTVAFASSLLYFLPGFFGYVRYPSRLGIELDVALSDATYGVFCLVLLGIILGGLLFELIPYRPPPLSISGTQYASTAAFLCAVLGVGAAVLTSGSALFDSDKDVVLAQLNRWYLLGSASIVLLAAFAFVRRQRTYLAVALCGILFDLYVGFRDAAAFTAISLLTLHLATTHRHRLLWERWRAWIPAVLLIPFLLLYKALAYLLKSGEFGVALTALGDSDLYLGAIDHSEPFAIQTILNEVLDKHFHVDPRHLMDAINGLLVFSGDVGLDSRSFNDMFQPALFPYVDYGMANNIWAEMYASGGIPLLLVFIVFFSLVLACGSWLLRSDQPELRAATAVLGVEWAFYIHRNDLTYQFTIEKRTALVAIVCLASSALLVAASKNVTQKRGQREGEA